MTTPLDSARSARISGIAPGLDGTDPPAGPVNLGSAKGSWWSQVGWRYGVGLLALAFAVLPILFIISAAFNPAGTLQSTSIIPSGASLENFRTLLNTPGRSFGTWYLNSLIVSGATAVATVLLGATAAYSFSRYRFAGRRKFMLGLLLLQMFPSLLALVALYLIFIQIGDVFSLIGLNTTIGLVLAYLGGVMGSNVWLLKGYFDTVPKDLDESARVDGASHAQIYFGIVLPLVTPILATVALLSFVGAYSEFLLASIFLSDGSKQTLAVGLYGLISGQRNANFGEFCAGALLAALPVLALYLGLQRFLVGGLTSGSVKG